MPQGLQGLQLPSRASFLAGKVTERSLSQSTADLRPERSAEGWGNRAARRALVLRMADPNLISGATDEFSSLSQSDP